MRKALTTTALGAVLAAGIAAAPAAAQDVTIGWTAWSDAEAVTKLAQQLLTDRMGYDVELVLADPGLQYQGVAEGDIDFMMMSWLPVTHADYVEKLGDEMVQIGPIYTGAKLGWAVNTAVPDSVQTIADLAGEDIREMLDGQIQGIGEGAGLTRLSYQALEDYGLEDYQLVTASDAAMTAALDRATRRDEPIVVTTWNPHWMHAAYEVRYLEDPQGVLGGAERIYVMARQGFNDEFPEVFDFLARFYIPLDELQAVMAEANETSYEDAVANYIANNEARVNYWVTGEIPTGS